MFDTMMALVIPIAVVGILATRQTVTALFGAAFAPAASVLPLLMVSVVCMWFSHATAIATVAARLQHHFLWIQGICVTLFLAADAVLIPRYGVTGAAIGRLAAAALAPALTYWLLRHRTGALLSSRSLRRAGLAAVAMAGGVALTAAQPLAIVGTVGLVAYAIGLWVTGCNPFATIAHKESPA
jgi:O-antigen/teichoic acid export membrane protein